MQQAQIEFAQVPAERTQPRAARAPNNRVRVVLADAHDLTRTGLRSVLERLDSVVVQGEAKNWDELIELVKDLQPDLVVTDLSLLGMDGLTALSQLEQPELQVLVLSSSDSVSHVQAAVANGACGYLLKDATGYEVECAVRSVVLTGRYFSSAITSRLLARPEPTAVGELTPRQLEVLVMLAQGKTSKEIARELGLSSKTVGTHRANIMERLEINEVASLARYAVRKGLVNP